MLIYGVTIHDMRIGKYIASYTYKIYVKYAVIHMYEGRKKVQLSNTSTTKDKIPRKSKKRVATKGVNMIKEYHMHI
jgi:isocitrate dehydrogenase